MPEVQPRVIVQELLDGREVAVRNDGGEVCPLVEGDLPAWESANEEDRLFADWALYYAARFIQVLKPGERLAGVWLARAHGTRYALMGREPFVVTDIFDERGDPLPFDRLSRRIVARFCVAPVLHDGEPISLEAALELLGPAGKYAALDGTAGITWRVEEAGHYFTSDTVSPFHRPDRFDAGPPVWNWKPVSGAHASA